MIKNQKSQKGFTIIEVALVLAVGALIFLVVFLAVPALQRNQRNDARKRDQSSVVEAVTSYTSNNPAKKLTSATNENAYTAGAPATTNWLGKYLDQLSNNTEEVAVKNNTTTVPTVGDTSDDKDTAKKTIYVLTGATCNSDGKTTKKGTAKQAAVISFQETAAGVDAVCSSAN